MKSVLIALALLAPVNAFAATVGLPDLDQPEGYFFHDYANKTDNCTICYKGKRLHVRLNANGNDTEKQKACAHQAQDYAKNAG